MTNEYIETLDSFIAVGDGVEVRVGDIVAILKQSDKSIDYKKIISIGKDHNNQIKYETYTHQLRTMGDANNTLLFGDTDSCKKYKRDLIEREGISKRDLPKIQLPENIYVDMWNYVNELDPYRKKDLQFTGFGSLYNGLIIELIEQYLKENK